jgi:hypothetical protein
MYIHTNIHVRKTNLVQIPFYKYRELAYSDVFGLGLFRDYVLLLQTAQLSTTRSMYEHANFSEQILARDLYSALSSQ